MEDCKVFQLKTKSQHSNLYVIRCPNSSVTTKHTTGGKHKTHHHAIVVDGQAANEK